MSERAFLVVGNRAVTEPFNLNDLAGSAGRMDILCRCVAQALFISHGIRRNVDIYLLLLGKPSPPKTIKVVGSEVKNMAPDERNIAGLLRKSLVHGDKTWEESSPGIYVAVKSFDEILNELSNKHMVIYLREDGEDIRKVADKLKNPLFVLGDHLGLSKEMEEKLLSYAEKVVSLSPISLQADQCILITHYELDRIDEALQ
jgi:tRNA (pseudouridine54-N1)-methyltransferase